MANEETGGKFPPLLMHTGMRIKREGRKKKKKKERRKADREEKEMRRKGEGDFSGLPTVESRRSEN